MSKMNGGFLFFHGPWVSFEAPQNFVESVDRSFGPKCVPWRHAGQGGKPATPKCSQQNRQDSFFRGKGVPVENWVGDCAGTPTSSSTENTVPIGQWNAVAVSMRGSCGVSFRCSANISGATETEIGLLGRTLRCMVDILLWVIGPESSTFVDPWTILNIYPAKCCTWSKLVELIA